MNARTIGSPSRRLARLVPMVACLAGMALSIAAEPAQALKVVTWNLLHYPAFNIVARQPKFRTVMANMQPDILMVQEFNASNNSEADAARDSMLSVLNGVQPGQWAASSYITLNGGEYGCLFYKTSVVSSVSNISAITANTPRKVFFCIVTLAGYTSPEAKLRLFSVHFNAGVADSALRRTEAINLRTAINTQPPAIAPNFLVGGDMNLYSADEDAYVALTQSQADNDGRCKDYLTMPGPWNTVFGYRAFFTNSPCATGCTPPDQFGGGLDDRFDLFLSSYSLQDGEGMDIVGYAAYGNDGDHFNTDINGDGYNLAVPIAVANALHDVSDHIPVVITLQLPARLSTASEFDVGSAIVGGTAQQTLNVTNSATAPADELNYSFTAPSSFGAPGGGFIANSGVTNPHTISMNAVTAGPVTGTLTIASDFPDTTSKPVLLSGKALDHAASSLDSAAAVTAGLVAFGRSLPGGFADQTLRLHNLGYDPFQARLSVTGAIITGGGGRFSIPGGFTPSLIAGTGTSYTVHFNDTGAPLDSTYTATLTFTTADEALPGAQPAAPLVVTLVARPVTTLDVSSAPGELRIEPARPNPFRGATAFRIGLPSAVPVVAEVFDLSGRRLRTLHDGVAGPSWLDLEWDGTDESGARSVAGLYFVRIRAGDVVRSQRVALLP